jgi:hypothetical protein
MIAPDAHGRHGEPEKERSLKLNSEPGFSTATMARVYASQGHFEKAAGIYRNLLAAAPERKDLSEALAETECNLAARVKDPKLLLPLLNRWIELSFAYRRMKMLTGMKRQLIVIRRQ